MSSENGIEGKDLLVFIPIFPDKIPLSTRPTHPYSIWTRIPGRLSVTVLKRKPPCYPLRFSDLTPVVDLRLRLSCTKQVSYTEFCWFLLIYDQEGNKKKTLFRYKNGCITYRQMGHIFTIPSMNPSGDRKN